MSKPDFGELMRLGWGFRGSKLFLVANDWDLFSCLSPEPQTAGGLAAQLEVDRRALEIMLDALVSMGLLDKEHGCYRNRELAETYLVKGTAGYHGEIFKHLHQCWGQWNFLGEVVKTGHSPPQAKLPLSEERSFNRPYIWGMDNVGQERAEKILKKLDVNGVKRMLDLACGAATYSIAFAKSNPDLQAVALDLPLTLEVARENIARNGLTERFSFKEGSYWELDFGSGYDLVWLSQVVHCCDETQALELVKKAAASLAHGGRLMVHDFLMDEERTSPEYAAVFSVHMLVVTEGGRAYTVNEVKDWFVRAGLSQVELIEVDSKSRLVVGVKP